MGSFNYDLHYPTKKLWLNSVDKMKASVTHELSLGECECINVWMGKVIMSEPESVWLVLCKESKSECFMSELMLNIWVKESWMNRFLGINHDVKIAMRIQQ